MNPTKNRGELKCTCSTRGSLRANIVTIPVIRDGPFNFRGGGGGGGGGVCFFSKKNVLIPNVAEKNILILVEEKKII